MAAGGLTRGEGSLPIAAGVFVDLGAAASDIATANGRKLTRMDDGRISIKLVLLQRSGGSGILNRTKTNYR